MTERKKSIVCMMTHEKEQGERFIREVTHGVVYGAEMMNTPTSVDG